MTKQDAARELVALQFQLSDAWGEKNMRRRTKIREWVEHRMGQIADKLDQDAAKKARTGETMGRLMS